MYSYAGGLGARLPRQARVQRQARIHEAFPLDGLVEVGEGSFRDVCGTAPNIRRKGGHQKKSVPTTNPMTVQASDQPPLTGEGGEATGHHTNSILKPNHRRVLVFNGGDER